VLVSTNRSTTKNAIVVFVGHKNRSVEVVARSVVSGDRQMSRRVLRTLCRRRLTVSASSDHSFLRIHHADAVHRSQMTDHRRIVGQTDGVPRPTHVRLETDLSDERSARRVFEQLVTMVTRHHDVARRRVDGQPGRLAVDSPVDRVAGIRVDFVNLALAVVADVQAVVLGARRQSVRARPETVDEQPSQSRERRRVVNLDLFITRIAYHEQLVDDAGDTGHYSTVGGNHVRQCGLLDGDSFDDTQAYRRLYSYIIGKQIYRYMSKKCYIISDWPRTNTI